MKSQLKVTSVDKIKWNIFITQLIHSYHLSKTKY